MKMTAVEKYLVNRPSHAASVARHAERLLNRIEFQAGWRYLDVGCGTGAAARRVAETWPLEVTGVDVDPDQIRAARAGRALPNLRYLPMDGTRLEFADGEFDIVATNKATHHISSWERVFTEMARVLQPGGYLIYNDFVVPGWLAAAGKRLVSSAGFPTRRSLDALAARARLILVHRSHRLFQMDAIWRKEGAVQLAAANRMPLTFRLATQADYQTLETLVIEAFGPITWYRTADERFGPLNGRDWRARWKTRFARIFETQIVLVGEHGGEIVAVATGTFDGLSRLGYIDLLGVAIPHQGKGYGREMLRGMLHHLKNLGAVHAHLECLATNQRGNELYRSQGFEEVARSIRWFIRIP